MSAFLINFAAMKRLAIILLTAAAACSCTNETPPGETFTIETINRTTPVKDQGQSGLCWIYAMLATIEGDRLAEGDSVNLSAAYVARRILADRAERCYMTRGGEAVTDEGTAPDALDALADYGAMTYDAYRSDCNFNALCRRLTAVAKGAAARREGIERLRKTAAGVLDDSVNPVPPHVWMYGVEYSPRQLAASLFDPADYTAMTSYTHLPAGEAAVLEIPANRRGHRFVNVPLDTLVSRVERALGSGRNVCWEGDTSNAGFSFERGVARLEGSRGEVTQETRQRAFSRLDVTDDHCMALIGLAHDARGNRYFVCKNSWGKGNPYGGLIYMSLDYFRLNTVAVVMKKE